MRVFFSAWPSDEAAATIAGLDRPEHEAIRWTPPAAWHTTLLFVGEVDEAATDRLTAALEEAASMCRPAVVTLGPALAELGGQLVAPVAGLDDLAAAVRERVAAAGFDLSPAARPFRGHLTVARSRGRRDLPVHLVGAPVQTSWTVDEITLVRSDLSGGGSAYQVLAARPLTA